MDWVSTVSSCSDLADALSGAVIGAIVAIIGAELVRWLRKPRAEFVDFDHGTQVPQQNLFGIQGVGSSGVAQFHKVCFKVRGQPAGLAAAKLAWAAESTFAKWDEQPEPLVSNRFEAFLVPSTFFLQLSDDEKYQLPVLIEYDDAAGQRQCDVFAGWWYGKGLIGRPASFRVSDPEEIEITLLGLAWQKPWRPWTRQRKRRFRVSELRTG